MTSMLSCLVATIALGGDSGLQGLPFGVPPKPEDAVIASVAPPECLFYLNWAGTAAPDPASKSETEKMLAEPEVQGLLNGLSKVIVAYLRQQDKAKKADAVTEQSLPSPQYLSDDVQYFPPGPQFPLSKEAAAQKAISQEAAKGLSLPETPAVAPVKAPADSDLGVLATSGTIAIPPGATNNPYSASAAPAPIAPHSSYHELPAPVAPAVPSVPFAQPSSDVPRVIKAEPKVDVSYEDIGDWVNVLLTHPTAVFLGDVHYSTLTIATASPNVEIHAGMVVSLGSDAARLHMDFIKYLRQARKDKTLNGLKYVKIEGTTFYRVKSPQPGCENDLTFGFYGKYFIAAFGEGTLEGMLARWHNPAPAWLATAMRQTPVPRRTGIIYCNIKALRDQLLPLADLGDKDGKKKVIAALELLGLNNVDSLVSTTGLEDSSMVSRTLLAIDGKPRGLLDLVADRPLTAKDLEPIPDNALLAYAARFDLDRSFHLLVEAYEKACVAAGQDCKEIEQFKTEGLEKLGKETGIDLHQFLSSVGDTWCVYNSPTEGEIAFLGWTAVVTVRDRDALLSNLEKLCAYSQAHEAEKNGAAGDKPALGNLDFGSKLEVRQCRYASHTVYYLAGQAIAPAFYISDHDMVMTLNMPAMKAYLSRKDHRSLAALPDVALALKDQPVTLGYCDTPKLFDFFYPLISIYGSAGAALAHQANIDLEPTYWPSAPAIRAHLHPDVTTFARTPHGLEFTSRYSLPTGGLNWPIWLSVLGSAGNSTTSPIPQFPVTGILPSWLRGLSDSSGLVGDSSCESTCELNCPVADSSAGTANSSFAVPDGPAPDDRLDLRLQAMRDAPAFGPVKMTDRDVESTAVVQSTTSAAARPEIVAGSEPCPAPYGAMPMAVLGTPVPAPIAPPCSYDAPAANVQYQAPIANRSPALGGLAKNPAFGAAVTVSDVIAMHEAKVVDQLIINHIQQHGLAAPLRPADVISLSRNGVSPNLIAAMQSVVAEEECSDPPPARRAQELIYTSENDAWERSRLLDQPAPPPPQPDRPKDGEPSQGNREPRDNVPNNPAPIGLTGPPHIPLGVPTDLQKQVMFNHTFVDLPQPESKLRIDVKQEPGVHNPEPVNHVRIIERASEPAAGAGAPEPAAKKSSDGDSKPQANISGKLLRYANDRGPFPYAIMDQHAVVRGYAGAAPGVDLDSCVGKQVTVQGAVQTLPGNKTPCLTCERILYGDSDSSSTTTR